MMLSMRISEVATSGSGANDTVLLHLDELQSLLQLIFLANGASAEAAEILAANCAACERDGATSHGIFRMPGYVASIKSGWVDPAATPRVEDVGASFIRVDAANGFTQPALKAATPLLIEKTRQNGVAIVAIRNSHHFSALWPDAEPFAEAGLLALTMVNSFACTVPFDATAPIFGTNPICFAAPCENGPLLVADLATSAIANGDVQIAARQGVPLPSGHGVDRHGQPTTDPHAVLDGGALLTFGGYKGSSISMMIEIFGAALTGGNFSFEVDWSDFAGAQTPKTGQILILTDPDCGRASTFARRARVLADRILDSGVSRLPGARRFERRQASLNEGIRLKSSDIERLRNLTPNV